MQSDAVTIDPVQVWTWVHTHQWAPIIALGVGLAVRLVKDDSAIGLKLPAPWRPWFALLLTTVVAGSAAILGGMAWKTVVENDLLAFAMAVLGHETIIEGARGGVEVHIPFLTKKVPSNDTSSPPTIPGPPPLPGSTAAVKEPPKAA